METPVAAPARPVEPSSRAKSPARRWILWLHMACGVAIAIYAVLLGVSGSILVFRQELTALADPDFHNGPVPEQIGITPDQALAAARAAHPGWTAYSVTWPSSENPHFTIYMTRGGRATEAFVNAAAGSLIGSRDTRDGLAGWLTQLHVNLLLGSDAGHLVQAIGVFSLLAMCASGLWLWWPAGGVRLASRFRLDWRANWLREWRRLSWQLHHVAGALGLIFIAMWAATGGYYLWYDAYIRVVETFFERAEPPVIASRPAGTPLLTLEELSRHAQAAFPDHPLYRTSIPSAPDQTVSVTLLEATPAEFHRVSTAILDPVTGEILQQGGSAERPAANTVLSWISVLHFGRFGGRLNLLVRIAWSLLGLTLPLLAVSGLLMWWRRAVEPGRRRETPAGASSVVAS